MEFNINIFPVLISLIMWLVLFIILNLLRNFIPMLFRNSSKALKYFSLIEILTWSTYFIIGISYLYNKNFVFSTGLLLLFFITLYFISIYSLKNYIAGMIFRLSQKIKKGERIILLNESGEVVKLGTRNITLINEKGNTIYIPYSKIINEVKHKNNTDESMGSHVFDIELKGKSNIKEQINTIKQIILNSPWTSLNKDPLINISKENQESIIFRITVYSIDESYGYLIEEAVRKKINI